MMNPDFVVSYQQIRDRSPRAAVRHAALSVLAAAHRASGRTARALRTPRVQILNLHHVFDDEVDAFRRLLRALSRDHSFIGYSEAVRRVRTGELDRPYVVFTFDDGFKSCLTAARVMDEFGARACFYICPSIVGESDPGRVSRFCRERLNMPPTEFMTWDDVHALLAAGHEAGNHTWDHPLMAALSADEAGEQVARTAEELGARGVPAPHFAWPFGHWQHFGSAQAAAVFRAGMESCASGERGCHVAPAPGGPAWRMCLRRDHVLARWPVEHVLYFMARNAERAGPATSGWHDGWDDAVAAAMAAPPA